MEGTHPHAIDRIFARWHSPPLSAEIEFGVVDIVGAYPTYAVEIADQREIGHHDRHRLLAGVGWEDAEPHYPENDPMGAVEVVPN